MVTENQSAGHSSAVPSTAAHVPATRSQPGNTASAPEAVTVVKTRDASLPFVVTSRTKRGRHLHIDYFDPETIGDRAGYLSGLESLALLLAALEKNESYRFSLDARSVLIEAGKKASVSGTESARAGFGFMCAASELLQFAARNADWRDFLANRIAMEKRNMQWFEGHLAADREKFVSRMRAAKAAKRRAAAPSTVQTPVGAQQ